MPPSVVLFRSQLLAQARASEERYASSLAFPKTPTSPSEPDIEAQRAGSIGQGRHHSALDGNLVALDFMVEGLAQRDDVVRRLAVEFCRFLPVVPELHAIKKVEAGGIGHDGSLALLFCAKENGGTKDGLKTLHDSVVVVSVLGQFEVVEQRRGTGKADPTTLLENGEGRHSNGDQTVLAEGQ